MIYDSKTSKVDYKEIEYLLDEYNKNPSQQLSNRIALKLKPYCQMIACSYSTSPRKGSLIELDDLTQELFLVAVRSIQRSVGHPNQIGYVLLCIKGYLRHYVFKQQSLHLNCSYLSDGGLVDKFALQLTYKQITLDDIDAYEYVATKINALPDLYKESARLNFLMHYSINEIAIKLNRNRSTISNKLSSARKILAKELEVNTIERGTKALTEEILRQQLEGIKRSVILERFSLSKDQLKGMLKRYKKNLAA